jgi:threonine dehydratase
LEEINETRKRIFSNSIVPLLRTPLLINVQDRSQILSQKRVKLSLKLENMQTMGSYKIRGILNQMNSNEDTVTMSAGNYGRAFSYLAQRKGMRGVVVMPQTAPPDRIEFIKNCGVTVELAPVSQLQQQVETWVKKGYRFAHPFDDPKLIAGYGSIGLEILEDLPDVDIVVVCVGGGGLYSGLLTAINLKIKELKRAKPVGVIGVEPEGANSMYLSIQKGHAVEIQPKTIAHGLAPPYAGKNAYAIVKEFGGEIILVSDDDIKEAVKVLYEDYRILSEASGAAAFAAILKGKIDVQGKSVACIISGGNISPTELQSIISPSKL